MDKISQLQADRQQEVQRLKKTIAALSEINNLRKYQIGQFSQLVKKLLVDKVITIDEVKPLIQKKQTVKNQLGLEKKINDLE